MLRSIVQNVRTTLTREARELVGADVVVQSNRPWTPRRGARLDELLDAAAVAARTEYRNTDDGGGDGGDGDGRVRWWNCAASSAAFPFYGTLELQGGQPYSHALLANHGALVQPEMLAQLGLQVGDACVSPGSPSRFAASSRAIACSAPAGSRSARASTSISTDLRSTALLGFGSRASYQMLAARARRALSG